MPLYRGSGGSVFEINPPAEGTNRREIFDAQIASGDLVIVEPAKKPAKPAVEKPE